jgi:hypothetical protein
MASLRLIFVGALMALGSSGWAAIIVAGGNGSFESPVLSSPFYDMNASDVPGWTHSGTVGDAVIWAIGYTDPGGSATVAGDGNQFATLGGGYQTSGSAGLSTTITGLTAGASYVLSFDIANEGGDTEGLAESLTVSFSSGSSTGPQLFTAPPNNINYWRIWLPESETFVATADSATVTFAVTNQPYDMGLDAVNVAAVVTGIPEPGALPLWACGLAGALAIIRLKKPRV